MSRWLEKGKKILRAWGGFHARRIGMTIKDTLFGSQRNRTTRQPPHFLPPDLQSGVRIAIQKKSCEHREAILHPQDRHDRNGDAYQHKQEEATREEQALGRTKPNACSLQRQHRER